jgi:PAS domain S-box-containing protein
MAAIAGMETKRSHNPGEPEVPSSGREGQLISKVEEQEKFEFIFRNTHEAIVILELAEGKAGRVLDANRAALELFGKGPESIMQLIPPKYREDEVIGERGELFRQVMEKGYGRVEHRVKTGKGRVRWLEITAHAFTRTGKKLVIAIISDRTRGKETEAALRESERLYRTLFEAAEDPIGLFSVDREIILINSAFHKTFGYERDEFMALDWMEVVHPDDRQILDTLGGKLLREGILTVDYRARHKSGDYLFLSSRNVVIPGEDGEKEMILTIIRDVTERRLAMQELGQARERAEESDKLKSAFLANMSHEIRTPMNSIVGFSNLLVNPGLTEEVRSMYVKRIVRNSELLLAMISDIIDLAKIESGQLPIIYGKQKLSLLIGDMRQYALDELKRLDKHDIRILTEGKNTDCEIETDVIRLAQIMKNLINNAIKFTESGSVRIGCRSSGPGQSVILFVEDTGMGIAPEHLDLVFDQFRQVDGSNTRKYRGTGLGLAICRNLVHLMGGKIWVESREEEGSLFQVELPLKASRRVEPARSAPRKSAAESTMPGPLFRD